MLARQLALAVLLLFVADASAADKETVKLDLHFDYFECTVPKDVSCLAGNEAEKAKCTRCAAWRVVHFQNTAVTTYDPAAYRYDGGDARANQFIYDAALSTVPADSTPPSTSPVVAPKFNALYAAPEKYDFLTLDSQASSDAFVISNRMGAVYASTITTGKPVIHPSDSADGAVRQSASLKYVFPASSAPVKKIVPRRLIRDATPQKDSLVWNMWADQPPGIDCRAMSPLEKDGKDYRVTLHLAALKYGRDNFKALSGPVLDWIGKWIDTTTESQVTITVLALPDRHFKITSPEATIRVDLAKIRKWRRDHLTSPTDAFEVLRQNGCSADNVDFAFAEARFGITTTGVPGVGTITFSIWNDEGIPVDEVVTSLCVEKCSGVALGSGLAGLDSIRLLRDHTGTPDAALHVVTSGSEVKGILHVAGPTSKYTVWTVSDDIHPFLDSLRDVMKRFEDAAAEDEGERAAAAIDFRDSLFPNEPKARRAREIFETFLSAHIKGVNPPKAKDAPSLFVRMLAVTGSAVPSVPLGLYPLPRIMGDQRQDLRYAGFFFRVEAPLPIQSYDAGSGCIAQWYGILSNTMAKELVGAAARLRKKALREWAQGKVFPASAGEGGFSSWMRNQGAEKNAVLYVLGHHDDEGGPISFADSDVLRVSDVKRVFPEPSVAILNACGSVRAGSDQFVRAFNAANVEAVIATKHQIAATMAVQFTEYLLTELRSDAASSQSNISVAFFDALQSLREDKAYNEITGEDDETSSRWGSRVLAYSLLGNGGLMVCAPDTRAVASAPSTSNGGHQ